MPRSWSESLLGRFSGISKVTSVLVVLLVLTTAWVLVSCELDSADPQQKAQQQSQQQAQNQSSDSATGDTITFAQLPTQAGHTIRLIERGGPFPYERDGSVFGNYEGYLPKQKRGFYREYTVATPGVSSRGARRIVAGSDGNFHYTA